MAEGITTLLIKYKTDTLELEKAKTATSEMAKKIKESGVDYNKLDKEQKKTYDSIIKNNKKATESTGNFSTGIKSAILGYATFSALKSGIKVFSEFDDQLKRTQALTGATATESMELEKQSKKLGATTAFSASQVARAQGNMGQSGLKANEILKATPGILSLASAAQIDLSNATDIVTSGMNIFNLKAEKSTQVADMFAKAQATSAGDANFFSMAIMNSGASAKSLGYDMQSTISVLSTLAPSFKEGGSAGTALNSIFRDLSKGMDKQGYIMLNNKKVMVAQNGTLLSMDKIIGNVTTATEGMTGIQRRQTLSTKFGDEAMRGLNVLYGAGSEKIKGYDESMRGSTGTAKTMADMMESGMGGSLRNMGSALEGATISIIEALTPAINVAIETMTGLFSVATQVADLFTEYPKTMWAVTAALTGYTVVMKGVALWNTIVNATNPFGWITIAVGGAVLALGYLENKFQAVSKGIAKVKGWFGIESEPVTATESLSVPAFANGTNNAPGGISLVGENGPELLNLNKGSKVVPAGDTEKILGKGKGNVNIDGDKIEINIINKGGDSTAIIEEIKVYLDRRDRRKQSQVMAMLGGA